MQNGRPPNSRSRTRLEWSDRPNPHMHIMQWGMQGEEPWINWKHIYCFQFKIHMLTLKQFSFSFGFTSVPRGSLENALGECWRMRSNGGKAHYKDRPSHSLYRIRRKSKPQPLTHLKLVTCANLEQKAWKCFQYHVWICPWSYEVTNWTLPLQTQGKGNHILNSSPCTQSESTTLLD